VLTVPRPKSLLLTTASHGAMQASSGGWQVHRDSLRIPPDFACKPNHHPPGSMGIDGLRPKGLSGHRANHSPRRPLLAAMSKASVIERKFFMFRTAQLTLASLLLALAGCGGGGTDGAPPATGTGLAGIWRTDISTIIADNPGIFAGIRARCSGPVALVLRSDGRYTYDLDGTCVAEGISGTAQSNVAGNYRVSGTQIIVSGSSGSGRIAVGSVSAPLVLMSDGTAAYTLSGNQLELRPASGPGTVQRFTRSAS
jgi:hypothetical protein